ncbi:hypothetical protein N9F50_00275, partial [Akkermansiaceae bacterium]|nr:hypothetical protein [Akkermansiaceae bacterium]
SETWGDERSLRSDPRIAVAICEIVAAELKLEGRSRVRSDRGQERVHARGRIPTEDEFHSSRQAVAIRISIRIGVREVRKSRSPAIVGGAAIGEKDE